MLSTDKITCIIVEDELPATTVLRLHIAQFEQLELKGSFRSIPKAFSFLQQEVVDLIFLDIHLPEQTGIELAKLLPSGSNIIFTTADKNFALEGFELGAVDYLLKPISLERFRKSINRFLKHNQLPEKKEETNRPFIFVKCERRMKKIYLDEILYIEAQRNYLAIYTEHDNHLAYISISDIEDKLPTNMFLRIHRSFIISLSKLEGFNQSNVIIQKKEIPVGRNYKEQYKKALNYLE